MLTFVTSRTLTLDDIVYMIGLYEEAAGIGGQWECKECKDQGPISPQRDRDIAMNRCEVEIQNHHRTKHTSVLMQ